MNVDVRNLSWSELASTWRTPAWIQDAKFGLWAHWGPQSVPRLGGGWYARHMYMPDTGTEKWGRNAYRYHCETYGHPSEYGYKDLIHDHFKAERFDAGDLVRQFKDWGARYVAIIANHHDNYDLYPTFMHEWNSVRVGPGRDLLGEFATAARGHGLPWVATVHAGHNYFPASGTADATGPKAGVPYDLALTKADGAGRWWDGLDPRRLYGPTPDFAARTAELLSRYKPDMVYLDHHRLPTELLDVLAAYYRDSRERHGAIEAIVTVKIPEPGTMLDIERGQLNNLQSDTWQACSTMFNGWFRKEDEGEQNLRYDTRCLIEMLTDVVSKNGVMLLNVALYGDGSIPDDQAREIQGLADWLRIHGEAVYETRPWRMYGVGGETGEGHFSERTRYNSKPWGNDVLRFTQSKDGRSLYAFIYGPKPGTEVVVKSLSPADGLVHGQPLSVSLVGGDRLTAQLTPEGLRVRLPETLPSRYACALKIGHN